MLSCRRSGRAYGCRFRPFPAETGPGTIIQRWTEFSGLPQREKLPSAPQPFLTYLEADNRPQPLLDRDIGQGMGIAIGRLREDPIFDYKFACLSHNTIRGAAGGAISTAELLTHLGYLTHK